MHSDSNLSTVKLIKNSTNTPCFESRVKFPCVLAYPDYLKEFKLYTDASDGGLGAVLTQISEDGKERPVAFASRTSSKSERNYDAHNLEFLALRWAVTDCFH